MRRSFFTCCALCLLLLGACSGRSEKSFPETKKTEVLFGQKSFVVVDVEFVNYRGEAATAVRVKDDPGYRVFHFSGYHPEIAPGTKLDYVRVYERQTLGEQTRSSRYYSRICVNEPEKEKKTCATTADPDNSHEPSATRTGR